MDDWEREELMIRVDERVKTIFNRMEKFETLFTNHLAHHEMWENDIKSHLFGLNLDTNSVNLLPQLYKNLINILFIPTI